MKNMFRTLGVCVLAATLILAPGCGKKGNEDRLKAIQKKGEITIACEGCWAPWNYHDESDRLVGFDVEVGQCVAEKLGVKATFVEGEWDSILAGVETGRYDLMINGVDITEDRQKQYDFSIPYCYNKSVLIVRSDNDEIKTFEDLKGKKTCNSINSTYMLLAESYGATCEGVDTLEETLNMVLAGRVDATINSELSFADYMAVNKNAELKIVAYSSEPSEVAIPMPKGENSDSLRAAINKAIDEIRSEGKLKEISLKYFGIDVTEK